MPINKKYLAKLRPERHFHIYNRTNNNDLLFRSAANRIFFRKEVESRLSYLMDFYSWCFLPNHFHYQVKTKSTDEAADYLSRKSISKLSLTESRFLGGKCSFEELARIAWTGVFQSYTVSYNKMYGRRGNLFYKTFKRVEIENEDQFRKAMVYIHTNPVKHGMVEDFRDFEWSSWNEYMSPARTIIPKEEAYKIFGNRQAFLTAHEVRLSFIREADAWLL